MNTYRNKINDTIAEYDAVMGLFYVKGHKYNDGPMIPLSEYELQNNKKEWEVIKDEEDNFSFEDSI